MAIGDLLQEGQFEVGDGIYSFNKVEGLDMPPVRSADAVRPLDHGTYAGTEWYGGRTVRWTLDLEGLNDVDLQSRLTELQAALQVKTNGLLPLAYQLRGQKKRLIFVKPRRLSWTGDADMFALAAPTIIFEVYAPDPRLYDQTLLAASGGLPQDVGGATFPLAFPVTFTISAGTPGVFVANNLGRFPTRPVAVIRGPVDDPIIENVTTGHRIRLFGLTLTSTDFLVIDLDARTILLNGTASRYSLMTSDSTWWELVPGDNHIRFTAAAYQADALLTLTYRSAWV